MLEESNLFAVEDYDNQKMNNGLSHSEALAKIYHLLENGKEWEVHDLHCSLKRQGLFQNSNLITLSGKMLREPSAATEVLTLLQSLERLPVLGAMDVNGNFAILDGTCPKTESGYTLSDVLEDVVDEKYFLSEKAVENILTTQQGEMCPMQ